MMNQILYLNFRPQAYLRPSLFVQVAVVSALIFFHSGCNKESLEFRNIINSIRQVLKKSWDIINDESGNWTNKDKIKGTNNYFSYFMFFWRVLKKKVSNKPS